MTSGRCRHEIQRHLCTSCAPPPAGYPDLVYVSGGGLRFHRTPECPQLQEGQTLVDERGGVRAAVRSIRTNDAVANGRSRCRTCFDGFPAL